MEVLFNQATKHVEIPQTQYVDKVAAMLVVMQRQVPRPSFNQETKHVEIPQSQYSDKDVDTPVVMQRQVPRIQTANKPSINQATKHAEIPQSQYIDTVVLPEVMQRQVPSDSRCAEARESPAGAVCRAELRMCP